MLHHQRSVAAAVVAGVLFTTLGVLVSHGLQASPGLLGWLSAWLGLDGWQQHPWMSFLVGDLLWYRLPLMILAYVFGALLLQNLQGRPVHLLLACALPWLGYVIFAAKHELTLMSWLAAASLSVVPVLLGLWLAGRRASREHPPLSFRRSMLGVR